MAPAEEKHSASLMKSADASAAELPARRRTRRLQLRRSERSRDAISRATQREWAHRGTKRTYERIDTAGDGSVVGCSCVLDGWEGSGRKRLDRNGAKKARVSRRHARLRGAPGPDRGRIWRFGSNRWVLRTGPDGVGTASGARRSRAGCVYRARSRQCERSRSRLGAPIASGREHF